MNEYQTKDLHLAAYLYLKGCVLQNIDRRNDEPKAPVYFQFIDGDKCREAEKVYWYGKGDELLVNIQDYIRTVKELRSRVFLITKPQNSTL